MFKDELVKKLTAELADAKALVTELRPLLLSEGYEEEGGNVKLTLPTFNILIKVEFLEHLTITFFLHNKKKAVKRLAYYDTSTNKMLNAVNSSIVKTLNNVFLIKMEDNYVK